MGIEQTPLGPLLDHLKLLYIKRVTASPFLFSTTTSGLCTMPQLKFGSQFIDHLTSGPPANGYMEKQTWYSVLRSSSFRSASELCPSPAEQEVLVPVLVVLLNRACVQQCMCSIILSIIIL